MNKVLSTIQPSKVITRTMASFKNVTHVIFDMDGLLLDTEKIYEKIIGDIAKSYQKPYPWDTRMRLLGTTERRSCEIAVNEMQLPCSVDDFQKKFREMCHDRLRQEVKLMPGAERLVRHLKAENVPICVATSSGADSVAIKTQNHRAVFDLFHHIVCGSTDPEVKEGKPAPYIFRVAAQRFDDKPHPDQCLVFEDAPNGVKAANAASMQVVMVPDKNVAEEMRQNATLVINSLEEFKPELFGLPPFKQ